MDLGTFSKLGYVSHKKSIVYSLLLRGLKAWPFSPIKSINTKKKHRKLCGTLQNDEPLLSLNAQQASPRLSDK